MGHVRDLWTDPPAPDAIAAAATAGRRKPTRTRNARWGHGKRWLANWTDAGRVRTKAFASRDEAEAWVSARDAGVPIRRASDVTFETAMRAWRDSSPQHRTSTSATVESTMRAMILPALGAKTLGELDRTTLQAAVNDWSLTHSPARVRAAWSYVVSTLKLAEMDGLIDRRPVGVKLPPVTHARIVPLTSAQVAKIANQMAPSLRSMVVFAAATGMRSGELRGLTWDRIGADSTVLIDRQLIDKDGQDPVFGPPKSAASVRRIAVDAAAISALGERGEGLVWRTRLRSPVTRHTASEAWRSATEDVKGLRPRSGWHDLRHFHASLLIAAGLSPRAVADRLGHADPSETLRTYAHLWPTDEARAVEAAAQVVADLVGSDRAGAEQKQSRP